MNPLLDGSADGSDNLESLINSYQERTGVVASFNQDNRLVLTAEDGRNISLTIVGNATERVLAATQLQLHSGGRLRLSRTTSFFRNSAALEVGRFN